MKKNHLVKIASALGALLLITGCACHNVRTAKGLAVVEARPGQATKGYVEFYSVANNYPVPVFLLDEQLKPLLLAGIGLKPGDRYCYDWHGSQVAERLRVAMPPGAYQFMIEANGERVNVPVLAGRLTPVEVDYRPLDHGGDYVVYRLWVRPFAPGPFQESVAAQPRPKK